MLNLLKADLYRVLKDKLFVVALILGAALSILIPLGYFFITWGTTALEMSGASAQESLAHAKNAMASAYLFTKLISAPAMPFSIVLGVFCVILLGKDRETCRNKIIVGHSRRNIYFSNLILTMIVYVGFMVFYTILTYLVSLIVLPREFGTDAGHVFAGIGLRLIGLICISLGITFNTSAFRSNALPVVLHILVNYLCMTAGLLFLSFALVSTAGEGASISSGIKILAGVIVPFPLLGIIGDFSLETIFSFLGTAVLFGGAFMGFGYLIFAHKKLK